MTQKKSVTIFTPFSGRWVCIYQYLKGLSALQLDCCRASLIFYDNSCDEDFGDILRAYLDKNRGRFASVKYVRDLTKPMAGHGDVKELAVARILENAKDYINPSSKYIFVLEDDTVCPPDALKKLFHICEHSPKVGVAQGIEVGRHDGITIGASAIDEVYHYPAKSGEVQPEIIFKGYLRLEDKVVGVEEIGGGGFYCTIFRTPLFKKIRFDERMLPMIFGTDVCIGPKVRKLGYKLVIDWSIRCTHYTVGVDDLRTVPLTCEPKKTV